MCAYWAHVTLWMWAGLYGWWSFGIVIATVKEVPAALLVRTAVPDWPEWFWARRGIVIFAGVSRREVPATAVATTTTASAATGGTTRKTVRLRFLIAGSL